MTTDLNDNKLSFSEDEVMSAQAVFTAFITETATAVQAPFPKVKDAVLVIGVNAIKAGARADLADMLKSRSAVLELKAPGGVAMIDVFTAFFMFADLTRMQMLFTTAVMVLRRAEMSPSDVKLQADVQKLMEKTLLAELALTFKEYQKPRRR